MLEEKFLLNTCKNGDVASQNKRIAVGLSVLHPRRRFSASMRLPRIRFSVRLMMIVVAIAAVALGANDVRLRRNRYLDLRSMHEWTGRACLTLAEAHASTAAANEREVKRVRASLSSSPDTNRQQAALTERITSNIEAQAATERAAEQTCRAQASYHDALRMKYDRAVRRPWISVEADPPAPE